MYTNFAWIFIYFFCFILFIASDPDVNDNNASSEGYKDYSEPNNSTDTNDIYNKPNPDDSNAEKTDDSGNTNGYDRQPDGPEYYNPNSSDNDEQPTTVATQNNFDENYDDLSSGPIVPRRNDQRPAEPDQNPFNFDQTSKNTNLFDSNDLNGNNRDLYSQKTDDDVFNQKSDDQDIYSSSPFETKNEIDNEPQRGDGGRLDETGEPTRGRFYCNYRSGYSHMLFINKLFGSIYLFSFLFFLMSSSCWRIAVYDRISIPVGLQSSRSNYG